MPLLRSLIIAIVFPPLITLTVILLWNLIFFFKFLYYIFWHSRGNKRAGQNAKKLAPSADIDKSKKRKDTLLHGRIRLVRRAAVVVGGDIARSPRMQYHAGSLMEAQHCLPLTEEKQQVRLFDEVVLVGYDCGNRLTERLMAGVAKYERMRGLAQTSSKDPSILPVDARTGIFKLPELPSGISNFVSVFGRTPRWIISTIYKVLYMLIKFTTILVPLATVSIRGPSIEEDEEGVAPPTLELLVTRVVLCQTPPAVPLLPLLQFILLIFAPIITYLRIAPIRPALKIAEDSERGAWNIARNMWILGNKDKKASYPVPPPFPLSKLLSARPRLIIDWHNLGYSLLELDRRPRFVTILYRQLESFYGRGHANITVSNALRMEMSVRRDYSRIEAIMEHEGMLTDGTRHTTNDTSSVSDKEGLRFRGAATAKAAKAVEHKPNLEPPPTEEEKSEAFFVAQVYGYKKQSGKLSRAKTPCGFRFPQRSIVVLKDCAPAFFAPAHRSLLVSRLIPSLLRQQKDLNQQESTPDNSTDGDQGSAKAAQGSNEALTTISAELDSSGAPVLFPQWVLDNSACDERLGLFRDVKLDGGEPLSSVIEREVAFNRIHSNEPTEKVPTAEGRILISSTSWTADDDYSMVIAALKLVDQALQAYNEPISGGVADGDSCISHDRRLPRYLWVIVTGKGATRSVFEAQVRNAQFSQYITVTTCYLQSYLEYSMLLATADAGLSLHTSSSGLDLPMKCVDMFGAGLPVVSCFYPTITELIPPAKQPAEGGALQQILAGSTETGWIFQTERRLATIIGAGLLGLAPEWNHEGDYSRFDKVSDARDWALFRQGATSAADEIGRWAKSSLLLAAKRAFVRKHHGPEQRWDDNWNRTMLPLLIEQLSQPAVKKTME